jgi:hypothetical protein
MKRRCDADRYLVAALFGADDGDRVSMDGTKSKKVDSMSAFREHFQIGFDIGTRKGDLRTFVFRVDK